MIIHNEIETAKIDGLRLQLVYLVFCRLFNNTCVAHKSSSIGFHHFVHHGIASQQQNSIQQKEIIIYLPLTLLIFFVSLTRTSY